MTSYLPRHLGPYLRHAQRRLGWLPRQKGGAFLLLGRDRTVLRFAGPLLKGLHGRFPRMNLFFATLDREARDEAASPADPPIRVLPLPVIGLGAVTRFIETVKPNLVLVGDGGAGLPPVLIDRLGQDGAAIVLLGPPTPGLLARLAMAPDLILLGGDASEPASPPAGVDPAKVVHIPSGAILGPSGATPEVGPAVERLLPLVVAKREYHRRDLRLERRRVSDRAAKLVTTRLLPQRFEAVPSLAALAERLGRPQTILCLGNGPSSEDPGLRGMGGWDTCFRVNHSWLGRGFFEEPAMVFTGAKRTIEKLPGTNLFGFHSLDSERDILRRCAFLRRRFAYATAERLNTVDFGHYGIYAPTNGAVMLATAVRLRPEKIIIAGIDLFSHPAGSYPGDRGTPNAYTVRHDRQTELDFILHTLRSFDGEVVIMGEVLQREWQAARTPAVAG